MTTLINWDKANELRNDVGPEDFGEVVEIFLEEVDDIVSKLGGADRSVEHDMHFLKGSASNLGFAEFADLCRAGEALAAAGQGDMVDLDGVVASYLRSKETFLAEIDMKLAS